MKIHNAGSADITFSDLKIPACGAGQARIAAGADALVYDEDAEKSVQLAALLLSGGITKLSGEEPNDGGLASDGPQIVTVSTTLLFSDFSAAALTKTVNLAVLPSNAVLLSTTAKHSALFVGPSVTSAIIKVGDTDFSASTSSVINGSVNMNSVAPAATSFETTTAVKALNRGVTTQLTATMTAIGANLSVLTAGSITINVSYMVA